MIRRLYTSIIIALFCLLPMSGMALAKTEHDEQRYILVTGFEPFGGEISNGSWEAVQGLQGMVFGDKKVMVIQLPVVWEKASEKMLEQIRKYHPVAIIAFGEAGPEPIRIEQIAKNFRQSYPDNEGKLPSNDNISKLTPPTLKTTLNIDRIASRLQDANIPFTLSSDAGGYLCNETFYRLMSLPPSDTMSAHRGFIHVPPLNAQVARKDGSSLVFDKLILQKAATTIVHAVADDIE